jgi:bacteriorhodopsin
MEDIITLSTAQYELIYNMLSITVATMAAAFVFFVLARKEVAKPFRASLAISAVVVGVACYHYFRIFGSFEEATAMVAGGYEFTKALFNDAYRYADWILTVPLLMVEAVAVLNLKKSTSRKLIAKLSIAALLMIALGYPGEIADDNTTRMIWGTLSTIPFVYILWVLWGELSTALDDQPERVQVLMRNLKLLLLATWGVYPLAYLAPVFGFEGSTALVTLQVGYCIADMTAKAGFGLLIYAIAREKSRIMDPATYDSDHGTAKVAAQPAE